jgi:purine-binding chemotaxis protein CheW
MTWRRFRRDEPIDWERVRQRLARAARANEEVGRLSPERARAVMDERARLLARPAAQAESDAAGLDVLAFAAGERYGVEARYVREVIRLPGVTPLPGAPEFLVGVVNLRGLILPVMDIRRILGEAAGELAERSWAVVLGEERAEFGLLAEEVEGLTALRADQVREPGATVGDRARGLLRGVTPAGLIVLDGAAWLRDPRLFVEHEDDTGP